MKRFLFLFITAVAFVLPWESYAQQAKNQEQTKSETRTLRGVITDQSGTMAGATVYLLNKDQRIVAGVVTGVQGEYMLTVPAKHTDLTIVVSFVGYKTVKVPLGDQKVYNARLVEDGRNIQEVVVTGGKIQKNNMGISRANAGTATELLDVSQFDDMSVTSIEDMLQGKMANLDIVSGSGDPGSIATIRIRGSASLNASNEPLIVIDNIPQDNEIDEDFNFGDANVEDFGTMLNISPNDIQSIEILKDAAATALWGPRAANGVILITTKQGGVHKPRFSISQKLNYSFEPKPIPLLNGPEYTTLMQDALWNWIRDGNYEQTRVNKLINQQDILYDRSYRYFNEFNCDTDWLDLISRNSINSTTDFSMDGGGEVANYRFSLGYEDQTGTTKGTDYSRITSRLNVNIRFSKKFKVESRFNYTEAVRNQPFGARDSDLSITNNEGKDMDELYSGVNAKLREPIRNTAMTKMPNMSPWVLDQWGNPTEEYFTSPESSLQGLFPNPLALVDESTNRTKTRAVGAVFSASYNPFKGFTIQGNISYTMTAMRNNGFLPSSVLNVKWSNANYNRGVEAQANKAVTFAEVKMNYETLINKKHRIVMTLADQIEASNNNSYSISTSGSGAEEVSSPTSSGKVAQMASAWYKRRTVGLVGSFNYVFADRYSLSVAGRLNANSNSGKNDRFRSIRPSIAGAWRMENEQFIKDIKWINQLKLRASWGKSDRLPNTNKTTGTFADDGFYMDYSAIKPSQMQLDNLRPEVVTQYNIGTDISILNGKINVTAEYYRKTTTDLLQQNLDIQSTTGYDKIRWYNTGTIRNRGWEVMVNLNNIVKAGDFRLSINNINVSRNVNEIVELPGNMVAEKYNLKNGEYPRKLIQGNPVGSIYGFLFQGIYQNEDETLARDASGSYVRDINGKTVPMRISGTRMRPGDAKYADLNYDGIIDEHDIVYLGSSFPTLTGGATLVLNYKSWTLRTSMSFRLGQSVISNVRHQLERMNDGNNQSKNALRRWRYEGDETDIPRAVWGPNFNSLGSSRFVEDASFLKIKDITLNYKLPQRFISKLGLSRASAFITSYNIITFTNYSGQDPEVGTGDGAYGLAFDRSRTPPARRLAVGLSFDF